MGTNLGTSPGLVLVQPKVSRVQSHNHALAHRFPSVVVDSFLRHDEPRLGTADSGHLWGDSGDFTPAVGTGYWCIRGRAAQIQPEATSNPQTFWSSLPSSSADATIQVLFQQQETAQYGAGIFYRSLDGVSGLALVSSGLAGTFYLLTVDGTTQPATLGVVATLSGPSWSVGEWHLLEVHCFGSSHTFWGDGVQFGSASRASSGGMAHGLFHNHIAAVVPFRRFKCLRRTTV